MLSNILIWAWLLCTLAFIVAGIAGIFWAPALPWVARLVVADVVLFVAALCERV